MTDATEGEGESTWGRLRRRKVVQWGIAYAAGAWGLLQGLSYVVTTFHWPERIQQLATLLLLIGLPVALTLAWYQGDRGERRVTRTELAILTALFLLGGGLFWRYQHATESPPLTAATHAEAKVPTTAIPTDNSIAVLPFVNMSSDREQEYFSDGISEELLNLLAQIPGLRVIARTSSFSFKGKEVDIATIARTLNVANVLEGSVRKSGDTLRITAQLIRASDSSHLWSQTYDRQVTDVFAIQDEIAAAVVDELKIKLLGGAPVSHATDPKAYALYLQARELTRRYEPADVVRSIGLYKQALALDPKYAPAWDGLAEAYYNELDLTIRSAEQVMPPAREAIRKALALDPQYAPAYARAALIDGIMEGDLASAARHIEHGLALDPANLELMSVAIKIARRLGRMKQATELAEHVVARSPVSAWDHEALAHSYHYEGRLTEAVAEFRNAIMLSAPGSALLRELLGETLLQMGDAEGALEEIRQEPAESFRLLGLSLVFNGLGQKADSDDALDSLIRKYPDTMAVGIAYAYAQRGEVDRAFEWLTKAADYRATDLGIVPFEPYFRPLHSDPRWLPFLRKHGMAPEQLSAIKFDVKVPN